MIDDAALVTRPFAQSSHVIRIVVRWKGRTGVRPTAIACQALGKHRGRGRRVNRFVVLRRCQDRVPAPKAAPLPRAPRDTERRTENGPSDDGKGKHHQCMFIDKA